MFIAILAAAAIPSALPQSLPEMRVLDMSKGALWIAVTNPEDRNGVRYMPSLTFVGDNISSSDPKAPAIVRSFEMVKCDTNEWKSPREFYYTAAGEGLEERAGPDVWVKAKPGTKLMRVADAACGRTSGQTLPAMPLATMVSTYRAYRVGK